MKIEAGKRYRLSDGRIVKMMGIDARLQWPYWGFDEEGNAFCNFDAAWREITPHWLDGNWPQVSIVEEVTD